MCMCIWIKTKDNYALKNTEPFFSFHMFPSTPAAPFLLHLQFVSTSLHSTSPPLAPLYHRQLQQPCLRLRQLLQVRVLISLSFKIEFEILGLSFFSSENRMLFMWNHMMFSFLLPLKIEFNILGLFWSFFSSKIWFSFVDIDVPFFMLKSYVSSSEIDVMFWNQWWSCTSYWNLWFLAEIVDEISWISLLIVVKIIFFCFGWNYLMELCYDVKEFVIKFMKTFSKVDEIICWFCWIFFLKFKVWMMNWCIVVM